MKFKAMIVKQIITPALIYVLEWKTQGGFFIYPPKLGRRIKLNYLTTLTVCDFGYGPNQGMDQIIELIKSIRSG